MTAITLAGYGIGDPWAQFDGRANAPSGTAQFPTLLNGYPVASPPNARTRWPSNGTQPPWMVAGVDYAVGPNSTPIGDPSTISGTGITNSGQTITIGASGSGTVIDGYDFTGNGAWNIIVQAANVIIRNCIFAVTSAYTGTVAPIRSTSGGTNLSVKYCTIDGGTNNTSGYAALIFALGAGLTVQYNWLKNSAASSVVAVQFYGSNNCIVQYNLCNNAGLVSGDHKNYIQFTGTGSTGTLTNPIITFNTGYQTTMNGNTTIGEMWQSDAQDSGSLANVNMSNNVGISLPDSSGGGPTTSFLIAVHGGASNVSTNVSNNYLDASGTGSGPPPALNPGQFLDTSGGTSVIESNNIDMRTGNVVIG